MVVSESPLDSSIPCAPRRVFLLNPPQGGRVRLFHAIAPPFIVLDRAGFGVGAYRVPYLPVIPTFFVRFVILSDVCGRRNVE